MKGEEAELNVCYAFESLLFLLFSLLEEIIIHMFIFGVIGFQQQG